MRADVPSAVRQKVGNGLVGWIWNAAMSAPRGTRCVRFAGWPFTDRLANWTASVSDREATAGGQLTSSTTPVVPGVPK